VSAGEERAVENTRATRRPRLDDRGKTIHRPRQLGVDRRPLTEIVDDRAERLDLRGERASGRTVTAVLDLESGVVGAQLFDLEPGAPPRAESDEHGKRKHAERDENHATQADRDVPHGARKTVSDYYRVTSRSHELI
jgi:hypothetical protein